jgi:hypothetical protein
LNPDAVFLGSSAVGVERDDVLFSTAFLGLIATNREGVFVPDDIARVGLGEYLWATECFENFGILVSSNLDAVTGESPKGFRGDEVNIALLFDKMFCFGLAVVTLQKVWIGLGAFLVRADDMQTFSIFLPVGLGEELLTAVLNIMFNLELFFVIGDVLIVFLSNLGDSIIGGVDLKFAFDIAADLGLSLTIVTSLGSI